MPIRVETDPIHGLAAVRAEGDIGADEAFAAIAQVWREPAYQERPWVLWDLRHANVEKLFASDVRKIVTLERQHRPDPRPMRMAIVASGNVGYGMARMVENMVGTEPIAVNVFRDDEAAAWAWLVGDEAGEG